MKNLILFSVILLTGCSKREHPQPVSGNYFMYQNLRDFEWDYSNPLQLDINNDAVTDFVFSSAASYDVTNNTIEKIDFHVSANKGKLILMEGAYPMVLNKKEKIQTSDTLNRTWLPNKTIIATRAYTSNPKTAYWEGAWKDKTNMYLAIKAELPNNNTYTGWIRISVAENQSTIIIHDCAFSKLENTSINAGDKD